MIFGQVILAAPTIKAKALSPNLARLLDPDWPSIAQPDIAKRGLDQINTHCRSNHGLGRRHGSLAIDQEAHALSAGTGQGHG